MRVIESLAGYIKNSSFDNLTSAQCELLKRNVLDSIGCAIGALNGGSIQIIQKQLHEFGGNPLTTFIGGGGSSPDRTAFFNTALVRFLNYSDHFISKEETCYPSDNLGGLLSAAEYMESTGMEFLEALALSYQIQCRMTTAMPIMTSDFNATTQLAFSVAAGVSKLLNLSQPQIENALAISGSNALEALAVEAEPISQWNGISPASVASRAVFCTFLAQRGLTGPRDLFEGPYGISTILGEEIHLNWLQEGFDLINQVLIKKYPADIHAQSTLEGLLELRNEESIGPEEIQTVSIDVFRQCFEMIGGGEYGHKDEVNTQEQAQHNLKYLAAVALLDGKVQPDQFTPERIQNQDVQDLLKKIHIRPKMNYTRHYPQALSSKIHISLSGGAFFEKEKFDYEGFITRPMTPTRTIEKFKQLTAPFLSPDLTSEIITTVLNLEAVPIKDLIQLLARANSESRESHLAVNDPAA